MTPQQIKRAKRLAEILGLITHDVHTMDGIQLPITENGDEFNPEQDKALLWDLQVNYNIELGKSEIRTGKHDYIQGYFAWDREESHKNFQINESLSVALIDCVIEINGGYDG
mgnify:FL=1